MLGTIAGHLFESRLPRQELPVSPLNLRGRLQAPVPDASAADDLVGGEGAGEGEASGRGREAFLERTTLVCTSWEGQTLFCF